MKRIAVVIALLCATSAGADALQEWKTPAGKIYFGDHPPEGSVAVKRVQKPLGKVAVQNPDSSFKKNGRRVPLGKREDLIAWIKRKGAQGAFGVEEASLRTFPRGREYFQKNGRGGLHSAVEFQGVLTVTDPSKFYETFTRGIGSAKAFGFGLLVIAPVA